jgi:hypothetical protein
MGRVADGVENGVGFHAVSKGWQEACIVRERAWLECLVWHKRGINVAQSAR